MIDNPSVKLNKCGPNDYRKFIKKICVAKESEVASDKKFSLNNEVIARGEKFDGFYGVCTNFNVSPKDIIKVNQRRWRIEESFRIMNLLKSPSNGYISAYTKTDLTDKLHEIFVSEQTMKY